MKTIQEYREELATLRTDSQSLIDKVAADGARKFTDEETAAQTTRFDRMDQIQSLLDEQAKLAKFAVNGENPGGKFTDEQRPTVKKPTEIPGRDEIDGENKELKFSNEEFGVAASSWLHSGELDRKFATITTATNNSLLLPKQVAAPIVVTGANAFRQALDAVGSTPVETPDTAKLVLPVLTASAGGKVDENATTDGENEPTTTESIELDPATYGSGSMWYSNQLLAANSFDLLSASLPALSDSKEQGLETDIVTALNADTNITNVVVASAPGGITYDDLVNLNNALPKRFDRQKFIVLSQDGMNSARKLKGSDGHPVLVMDPQNQDVARFNGTPVIRSDNLQSFGANHVTGYCISALGFRLRDVTQQNLQRYTADRLKRNQTGVELFAYHAFGWSPSAVAKLKMPAS